MNFSSLEHTNGILVKGSNSSVIGAKRSREDETEETGRNRAMKSGEDRQPVPTTESAQEITDAPGTNRAPQNQLTPLLSVVTTRTPDTTISPGGVTTSVSASTGLDTTPPGSREVNAEELVTVQPAKAQAHVGSPPSTRSSTTSDHALSARNKSSNNSAVETSSAEPRKTLTFAGSKVQRVGDGEDRSPDASRHEARSLMREKNEGSHEKQAPTNAGQWSPVRVKKCQVRFNQE